MPAARSTRPARLLKTPSGIEGLDEVLDGGFPKGRPVLVCGGAGCGKTLLGMQFLVKGAIDHGEPGVFIAFEEKREDLEANAASLGFDLARLEKRKLLSIDHVEIDPTAIVESGEYDLSGLFVRLGLAIDSIGAKRVVIDTLEVLFGGLSNYAVVRAELHRLFDWLKTKGVTAIITAERGEGSLTRHNLEEYVSDCVLLLDHRVTGQVSTRRMRVVKYRGSAHATNEFPFLIDNDGITVMPITSAGLEHEASKERVSSGVPALDDMISGGGFYRGSTILLTGTAGSGKTSLAAHFVEAACRRGERALYFSFEESAAQILRNMATIGLRLEPHVKAGRLRFISSRPTAHGLETHLAIIHKEVDAFGAKAVVLDPTSNFLGAAAQQDANGLLVRLIDLLKRRNVTALLTDLTTIDAANEHTKAGISSIVDAWILLQTIELSGERNRGLYILKARGLGHSNQIREFQITSRGIKLLEPYVGPEGVVTGSARASQEAREKSAAETRLADLASKRRGLERLTALHREQLARIEAEYESERSTIEQQVGALVAAEQELGLDRTKMAATRGAQARRKK